ncbi:hypothetical protein OC842_008024, partial [Tilletia horrida]
MQFKKLFFGAIALVSAATAIAVPQTVSESLVVRDFDLTDPTIQLNLTLTLPISQIEKILEEGAKEIAQVGGALTKAGAAIVKEIAAEIAPYVQAFEKELTQAAQAIATGLKNAAVAITDGLVNAGKALAQTLTYFYNLFVKYEKVFEKIFLNELKAIAQVGVQL